MSVDLVQITYEVKSLAAMVKDRADIARHISAVHGVNYFASDIEKILLGIKPTGSVPRALRQNKLIGDAIWFEKPLSTNQEGGDPLAIACLKYGVKNGGVMGSSANDRKAMLEALAA